MPAITLVFWGTLSVPYALFFIWHFRKIVRILRDNQVGTARTTEHNGSLFMASLTKRYNQQKTLGQVYTPSFVVCKMLDEMGYAGSHILGKTILDPACGDGRFLCEVCRRIIECSPPESLLQNLSNLHGWDIDGQAVSKCVENLNQIIEGLGIRVEWNVKQQNALLQNEIQLPQIPTAGFDFIVGNPPYIRIQHLDETQRKFIQDNYAFCKSGSTDIYIAFFELCFVLLKPEGVCSLITPNTYFYTETAKGLRSFFAEQQNLLRLTNYGDIQLFDNATTYSAITVFGKQKRSDFIFQKALSPHTFEDWVVRFENLDAVGWQLGSSEYVGAKGKKLGEIANIHVGITTLCDKAYIFSVTEDAENEVIAHTKLRGNIRLEKAILKPIIKASTLKNSSQAIGEYVLFPYRRLNGRHQIIPEYLLRAEFPLAYAYLLSVKAELDKRDNGKPNPVAWYAFGRSQGLDTSFGKKILFSPMNLRPNFILYENEDCTFYSGYCIKLDDYSEQVLSQLNSERMQQFMAVSSRDFRGGWKAYNKKIVEKFIVEL